MTRIAVIADDLTGAADTGIQFGRRDRRVVVLLQPDGTGTVEADVLVGVTDSRHDDPALAAAKVAAWAARLSRSQPGLIYKKIDSTLRGNLGAELAACMDAFPGRPVILAASFPAAGRTTHLGRLYLHGTPLEETEVGHDPTHPIADSYVPRLLVAQTDRCVKLLTLEHVRAGGEAVHDQLNRLLREGAAIIVADAVTSRDLQNIVCGVRAAAMPVIWCGSAGLAQQLDPTDEPLDGSLPARDLPSLTVVGSLSPTVRQQIRHFCREPGVALCQVDPASLDVRKPGTAALLSCQVSQALSSGSDTLLTTAPGALDIPGVGQALAGSLGQVVALALQDQRVRSLLLTGGDTAMAVIRHLGAYGIELLQELLPGVPAGLLLGGPFAGLLVIIKAGSFGEVDALWRLNRMVGRGVSR